MNKIKATLHNRFDFEVNGEWVGYAENIVLTNGLKQLANAVTMVYAIVLGKGTGTPTADRTSLFTPFTPHFYKTVTTVEVIRSLGFGSRKMHAVVNPSELVGETITEVGLAYSTGTTTLSTHALLRDAEGNPISITKTATDVINIYATLYASIETVGDCDVIGSAVNTSPTLASYGNHIIEFLLGLQGSFGYPYGKAYKRLVNAGAIYPRSSDSVIVDTKSITKVADIPNLRLTGQNRFEINQANFDIAGILFCATFHDGYNSQWAPMFYQRAADFNIVDRNIGTGDGTTKKFKVPFKYLKSIEGIKVNNVNTAYTTEPAYTQQLTEMNLFAEHPVPASINGQSYRAHHQDISPDGSRLLIAFAGVLCLYSIDYVNKKCTLLSSAAVPQIDTAFAFFSKDGSKALTQLAVFDISADTFVKIADMPNQYLFGDYATIPFPDVDVLVAYRNINWNNRLYVLDYRGTFAQLDIGNVQMYCKFVLKKDASTYIIFAQGNSAIRPYRYTLGAATSVALGTVPGVDAVSIGTKVIVKPTTNPTALKLYTYDVATESFIFEKDIVNASALGLADLSTLGLRQSNSPDTMLITLGSYKVGYIVFDANFDIVTFRTIEYKADAAGASGQSAQEDFYVYAPIYNNTVPLVINKTLGGTGTINPNIAELMDLAPDTVNIVLENAPAAGVPVTVSCTTPYIPKNANYVVDIAFQITFGEGV